MKLLLLVLCLLLTGCVAREETQAFAFYGSGISPMRATRVPTEAPTEAPTEPPTEPPTLPPDPIREIIDSMTTEELVGQLFLARYDTDTAPAHTRAYAPGGWLLFSRDFENHTPESIQAELDALQASSALPLVIAVDEEGGTVTRVSRHGAFRDAPFPSPRFLYARGGEALLLETEAEKCRLLASLGINVNLAPVCDISTDPFAFMYRRSLGLEAEAAGPVIAAMVETMTENGIGSVLKHFPGYGNNADTHVGIARDDRSLAALEAADLVPFRAGIDAGCGAVLVSHTIVTALDDEFPASLSPAVHRYLRREMGFEGVILTDDLAMDAITERYGPGEAAVLAVLAGNDLLCSTEYETQYEAVLAAVRDGRIPMECIGEAVYRVLSWKQELGLLSFEG